MADVGLNTVRTYCVPPPDVFDLAEEYGLHVLVGVYYHDWRMESVRSRAARRRVLDAGRRAVDVAIERSTARPCVLAVAVGNEVPADVVRVHGIGAVQDDLNELVARVHAADASLLATYVSFPTTEFLTLDDNDLACFNVFLEEPGPLRSYLRHLQVVAGTRPLLVTELGLAATLHGEQEQAASLRQQLALVDETGCAGATLFSWTDEWGVAGQPVKGWGFGVTHADRRPKPALDVVRAWAATSVAERREQWPRVSVVVCAYNEETTIGECLASLAATDYPDLEVIVCDDGSTDRTVEIAREFPFRVVELEHGGLSRARNAGLDTSTGEFVAYLDADAACHPEWPYHLVLSFDDEGVAAAGGPNLPFESASFVERAVARSPGAPAEVLVTDDRAEHVPGCNMAYRRHALEQLGGFDAVYTAAGDDVDVCWKLLERHQEIAFSAAAQVRHHRRGTVGGYLRQQRGYGRAERMLSGAHPQRFNRLGQARWRGFIYGGAPILRSLLRPIVYHGPMGGAPFQPVARRRAEVAGMWSSALLPLTLPVAIASLVVALVWPWALLAAAAVVGAVVAYGVAVAAAVPLPSDEPRPRTMRMLVGLLHVAQPFARAWGRLRGRPIDERAVVHPVWSGDRWVWLHRLEADLRARRCAVEAGGPSHAWDLRVTAAPFLAAYVTTAVMWQWEPRYAVTIRPRATVWPVLAAAIAVGIAVSWIGWAVLAGVLLLVGSESLVLRRRVAAALRHTTSGAFG